MAKQTLNTIKNWFKTGLKPTQQQFWDTWDSFWHKDQVIPTSSIENLDARFDEKADVELLAAHITAPNAHGVANIRLDDNKFEGVNQFTKPVIGVSAITDEQLATLGQVKLLMPTISIKDQLISKTGADVATFELDLSDEGDILYPSDATLFVNKIQITTAEWDFDAKKWSGLPETVEDDEIDIYFVGREYVAPPAAPNTIIGGMSFGSPSELKSYLISKGHAGAKVGTYYSSMGDQEAFIIKGISSLNASTFSGSSVTLFSDITGWLTGSIGVNCFGSSELKIFSSNAVTAIGNSAFNNCPDLISVTIPSVITMGKLTFYGSTSLSGKTISLPALSLPNGLGGTPTSNSIFNGITGLTLNDVPIGFASNNAGSPDGDLAFVIAYGGTVNYTLPAKYFKLGGDISLSGISGTVTVLMDGDVELYTKSIPLITTAEVIAFPDNYSGSITIRNTSTSDIRMSGLQDLAQNSDLIFNPAVTSYILTGITTVLSGITPA